MATSVQAFQATVPANTLQANPAVITLNVLPGVIDLIRWRVPPGPRGHLGWVLAMGGVSVIPEQMSTYIVADDEQDEVAVAGLPDSGAWQLIGYNTGGNDHTVYLYFHVTPTAVAAQVVDVSETGWPTSDADVPYMWLT